MLDLAADAPNPRLGRLMSLGAPHNSVLVVWVFLAPPLATLLEAFHLFQIGDKFFFDFPQASAI